MESFDELFILDEAPKIENVLERAKLLGPSGVLPFEALFRGILAPAAHIVILRKADLVLKLKARIAIESLNRSALPSSKSEESSSLDLEQADLNDANRSHFRRLINKLHAGTVYGLFEKESVVKAFMASKEYTRSPISYILAVDDTPMAFRAYLPQGLATANIGKSYFLLCDFFL